MQSGHRGGCYQKYFSVISSEEPSLEDYDYPIKNVKNNFQFYFKTYHF